MNSNSNKQSVICDECGKRHEATYSHEGRFNEGAIFAVVCDVDGLTDFYTSERVELDSVTLLTSDDKRIERRMRDDKLNRAADALDKIATQLDGATLPEIDDIDDVIAEEKRLDLAAEAEIIARATGSRSATVTHERRLPSGELVVDAVATFDRKLDAPKRPKLIKSRRSCIGCGMRPGELYSNGLCDACQYPSEG
jgi:hypothetical protein